MHIALLRGINVGGHRMVSMAALRDLAVELGFREARTLLQSGNLVLPGASRRSAAQLERLFEAEARKRFGLTTDFHVRTGGEWSAAIAANPLPKEAERDPGHFIVLFLKDAPEAKSVKALQAAISGPETVRVVGRQAYIVYPENMARSRLTSALLDKKLGTSGTGRNWNTVLKLEALATQAP